MNLTPKIGFVHIWIELADGVNQLSNSTPHEGIYLGAFEEFHFWRPLPLYTVPACPRISRIKYTAATPVMLWEPQTTGHDYTVALLSSKEEPKT